MSRRFSDHTRILIALVAGALAGMAANWLVVRGFLAPEALDFLVRNVTRPAGQVFLNLLFMVVIPLGFASLSLGVVSRGQVGKLGRLSLKTFGYFVVTTAASASLRLFAGERLPSRRGVRCRSQDPTPRELFGGLGAEVEPHPRERQIRRRRVMWSRS